jgi:hypothetical protein
LVNKLPQSLVAGAPNVKGIPGAVDSAASERFPGTPNEIGAAATALLGAFTPKNNGVSAVELAELIQTAEGAIVKKRAPSQHAHLWAVVGFQLKQVWHFQRFAKWWAKRLPQPSVTGGILAIGTWCFMILLQCDRNDNTPDKPSNQSECAKKTATFPMKEKDGPMMTKDI